MVRITLELLPLLSESYARQLEKVGNDKHGLWGSLIRILLQMCRSHPFTDGMRGGSNTFRDQHVFSPTVRTNLERQPRRK